MTIPGRKPNKHEMMPGEKKAIRRDTHIEHGNDNEKGPHLVVDNDEAFEKKHGETPLEIKKLRSDRVRRFQGHVDMFKRFRVSFQRELQGLGEKPEIAVANPHLHADASFAFKDAQVKYFVGTREEEHHYHRLGMEAQKLNPEMQLLDEPVDILIALYEGADATWRLERNVKHGGWLICRGEIAQQLLEESNDFKKMGTLDASGGMNQVDKSKEELNWEEAVQNDPDFKAESQKIGEGGTIATYDTAVEILEAAGRSTAEGHVVENLKKFIEDVMNGKVPDAKMDQENGRITYKNADMQKAIEIGIELPQKKSNGDAIVVLKKKLEGER